MLEFTSHPRIVEGLDEVENIGPSIRSRPVSPSVDALSLEHAEAALDQRVISAAADTAHAAGHVVALQETLVLVAGELAAAIRVQHQRRSILALPKGHQDSLQNQLAILDGTHRPADDPS